MKILGAVEEKGFILEVTRDEMMMLMGKGSYSTYGNDDKEACAIGKQLKIHKMYENARAILSAYGEIKNLVNSLKTTSTKITDFIHAKENPVAPQIGGDSK